MALVSLPCSATQRFGVVRVDGLFGVDGKDSFLRQGEQINGNFGHAVWLIGKQLFDKESSEVDPGGA